MGDRVAHQRGFGWRAMARAMTVRLLLAFNIPSAQADPAAHDGVAVVCPDLPEVTRAELEARARATLLTSDLSATVAVSCVGQAVLVQVDAGEDSVTLKVRVLPATLREEVLRAIDRALADLGARERVPPGGQEATAASAPGSATAAGLYPGESNAAETTPDPPADQPAPTSPAAEGASEMELAAYATGESWGHRPALGGGFRAAVRFDSTWSCGIRAGALHPLALREATAIEAHALLEAAVTSRGLAGLRFAVGAGPSLLFASPQAGFAASGETVKGAFRIELQVGRPFRWHRVELTPWMGARTFSAERGLQVGDQRRLVLGGVQPQFGLTLSLIH